MVRVARRGQPVWPRPWAAALGVMADDVVGEPPSTVHPVRAFGTCMAQVERWMYRDSRVAGVAHAALGTALGLTAGAMAGSTVVATYLAVAGRALRDTATRIGDALDHAELGRARALLPSLVGRDVDGLDAWDMARAVVESVAENTVDAVVAPACWAALAGAPGVFGYRAVNTMDAMVGYRDDRYRRYGWASARLDDAAAFVPARLTAVLVAVVRPRAAGAIWRAVRTQAPAHPSPNGGVAEAAFAAALDLRLGGVNRYGAVTERRPVLGTGRAAGPGDIGRAVDLARDVSLALAVLLGMIGLWREQEGTRSSPWRR
jgi:adenosylcobinamide-phosphate synthase